MEMLLKKRLNVVTCLLLQQPTASVWGRDYLFAETFLGVFSGIHTSGAKIMPFPLINLAYFIKVQEIPFGIWYSECIFYRIKMKCPLIHAKAI